MLRVGLDCTAQALPKRYHRAVPKACFANAIRLVRRSKGRLRYCEGFALVPGIEFMAFHHGWALDAENRVIDPTLSDPEDCAFIGIPMTLAEYEAAVPFKSFAVMTDRIECVNVDWIVARCPELASTPLSREGSQHDV